MLVNDYSLTASVICVEVLSYFQLRYFLMSDISEAIEESRRVFVYCQLLKLMLKDSVP